MEALLVTLCLLVFVLLVIVASVSPRRAGLGRFELERLAKMGNAHAVKEKQREERLGDLISLQRVIASLLLVVFVGLSVAALGWVWGVIVALLVALEYSAFARLSFIHKPTQSLYERYEVGVLRVIDKIPWVMRLLRAVLPLEPKGTHLESREELDYLVSNAGTLLSGDEKKLILHGLKFEQRTAGEIMTPRSVIDSIEHKELLGPLVLDGLHKTGHSRFPVIDGDIDHVVGMLYIRDLLELSSKKSMTAVKAMEPKVFYIREDQSLTRALAAFLRTHHHLFIVINEYRETVGLLALEDVIEAMLGRKIVDEFDAHDDLRKVAEHNPRENNRPSGREDV